MDFSPSPSDKLPGQIKDKVAKVVGLDQEAVRVLGSGGSEKAGEFSIVFMGAGLVPERGNKVRDFAQRMNLTARPGTAMTDSLVISGVCSDAASRILAL